jgi:hypothetical protein
MSSEDIREHCSYKFCQAKENAMTQKGTEKRETMDGTSVIAGRVIIPRFSCNRLRNTVPHDLYGTLWSFLNRERRILPSFETLERQITFFGAGNVHFVLDDNPHVGQCRIEIDQQRKEKVADRDDLMNED